MSRSESPPATSDAGDGWTVVLGASVALRTPDGTVTYPKRKQAGMVAFLAIAGPTPRDRLAEFLWPRAASARASLRQALHEARRTGSVFTDGDPVALAPGTAVERAEDALLSAFDFSDAPEFDEWLAFQRERDRARRLERLAERAAELERAERWVKAADAARSALALEPLSEVACRRLMRATYLSGDRAGALAVFRRFASELARELELRPLPETAALARDIERATVPRAPEVDRAIPITVDRPPLLAGRTEAWDRMERAWANGQVIYLSGPPGVGKTRLMHEFAASKVPRSRWNVFTARPGDTTAPYASQARAFRAVLDGCPGIELTPVMRRELSRLLPELTDEAPTPMTTVAEKNYFYATLAEVLILSGRWLDCWVADDWQFMDAASLEMANYMFANVTPVATDRKGQRAICTFRTEEVGAAFEAFLADLVRGGIAVHIDLDPLDLAAVDALLGSTGVAGAPRMARPMHRFTGGNPLFVVETLKSLLESHEASFDVGDLRDLLPRRVADVFDERFRRLDARRLRVLRFLAVAQTDASEDLLAEALEMRLPEVADALAGLERARLVDGPAFRHDLVYEAVRRSTPPAIRTYLHRRAAEALAKLRGPAARIAYHFERAGDPDRALPHYLDAADDARVRGAFDSAATWLEEVRRRDPDPDRVADATRRLAAMADLVPEEDRTRDRGG